MSASLSPACPEILRDVVAGRFGLLFDDSKLGFLNDVLRRRADARGTGIEAYLAQLITGANADEGGLAEELTVGETYFFRNGDQFRAFREAVLPERMAARADEAELSFLSAGCSSGEEPYSLAMLANDAVPQSWHVSIRAVDLNPAALRKARAARFTAWALRDTPAAMRQRWFEPEGREMILSDQIRSRVAFDLRNLADPESDVWQPQAYDVVFCRNVIMYFTPSVQQAVVRRIARSLVPGGYLFLGHAETLRGISQDFHLVHTHGTFYYRRKGGLQAAAHADGACDGALPTAPQSYDAVPLDSDWFDAIGRATRRIEALLQPVQAAPAPIAVEPASPQRALGPAFELLRHERFAEALAVVDAMPDEDGADPDVLLLRAMLLVQAGKPAKAMEACRALLLRDELNAGANYVLALCFEAANDRISAAHHYRVASYLDSAFAMPQLHLGMLLRRAGDLREARAALERGLELLKREEASRLLLFGGGFARDALIRLAEAELRAAGAKP